MNIGIILVVSIIFVAFLDNFISDPILVKVANKIGKCWHRNYFNSW